MSEERSLFHGWRARTHYLTRNRRFLLRTSASIIATGMIIACTIVIGSATRSEPEENHAVTPALSRLHGQFHLLRHDATPEPRQLATWLRLLLAQTPPLMEGDEAGAFQKFTSTGKLGGYDVALLIHLHATTDAPAGLFQNYLAATLNNDQKALGFLEQKAGASPPEMLAAELLGSVLKRRNNLPAAMQSFFNEGLHFPEAAGAREEALHMAVSQRDLKILRAIASQPGWIEHCPPLLQHHAGSLLGDVWMQWHGLIRHRLIEIPYGVLLLALFAAGLWYCILVQHSDHEHWRWLRPMAALAAGIASVWPTLTVLAYQEFIQGLTPNAPFPYDLLYYILGVGLREEGCKLVLFSFFLPWLMWRRTAGLALLTGAFIGLGFALEENIDYYQDMGGSIAWARFLSANFLHISLSGICAHSLYRMLLTRFARADEFITTFALVVAAHGGYDYLAAGSIQDSRWFSMVVLVLCVARFIDLLGTETRPVRLTISPRAVFTLGSAVLIAISLILGAWTTQTMAGVAEAGQDCLSMVPIAVLYWQRFENV